MRLIGLAVVLALNFALVPLAARAQQPARLPTIGFLGSSTPSAMRDMVAAFVGRLHELGWMEGRNIAIEYRWAEGSTERFAEISSEFVRLKVDVIITHGTAAVAAAKRATTVIPIVFASVGDPVGAGLVASLARPGGNVTGVSNMDVGLAAKRLELLREILPKLSQMFALRNPTNPAAVLQFAETQAAARSLGIEL